MVRISGKAWMTGERRVDAGSNPAPTTTYGWVRQKQSGGQLLEMLVEYTSLPNQVGAGSIPSP
jgi:hypothetical protein